MVTLRRTVRFCVNPDSGPSGGPGGGQGGGQAGGAWAEAGANGFAGRPAMRGLGRFYEVVIACRGAADAVSGYLVNIKTVDDAARRSVIPGIARACEARPGAEPGAVLAELAPGLARALAPVVLASVRWKLTPTYSVEVEMNTSDHGAGTARRVLVRQRFDFAAAHRLHAPGLSDAENRELFGKCNNPQGHGHNYVVEPCVAVEVGAGFGLLELERITEAVIIEPFDHKHLNEDTAAFAAVNPSVENMARVFFDLLAPAISGAGAGAALVELTVWETDRTSATVGAGSWARASGERS